MIEFTQAEISAYYALRVPGLKRTSNREWRCACPIHHGTNPNFSVKAETGQASCFSACQRGWDILSLEMEFSGKSFPDCKRAVFALIGRTAPTREESDIEALWDYTDEKGELLYQVVRRSGRMFSQRRFRPDGVWIKGLGSDYRPVPFQFPKLIAAELVACVEGEKDATNLTRAGIVATCNNGGAGNFKPALAQYFSGKRVMILPDNDVPGRNHALKVAEMLSHTAALVRIVELPDLPAKGDVSDFLMRGGTSEQILALFERAADWTPEWKFSSAVPSENDKWVRSLSQYLGECGGLEQFWNLTAQEGIATPWVTLTRALSGLRDGEVYIIGGNQGSGKTSLLLQFILKALRARKGTLLFSMEMQHRDVFQRMASIEARVDLAKYREFQRTHSKDPVYHDMRHALNMALEELIDLPLLVSTKPSVTPGFLLAEAERLQSRQRIDLVAVDHMQLMGAETNVRSEYEKFTTISRASKQIAMTLKRPVLIVSQTSRNNASDKRTELDVSDLRGSGALEEDAAGVMLLYPDKDDRDRCTLNGTFSVGPVKTWLKLGKNRYGEQGKFMPLLHYKTYTKFEEMEHR